MRLKPTTVEVTETLQLPIGGQPIRYPFDHYQPRLGVVLQRVRPNDTVQPLAPTDATNHLFLTFQEQLPRQTISPPVPLDPRAARTQHDPYEYPLVRLT